MADIEIPKHLQEFRYLDALYDRPEFIAMNVIRMYGGWWDGHPSHLLPAKQAYQAKEIVALAGGVQPLIDRARSVMESDERLACHLAEWAAMAEPESREAQQCVIDIFGARTETEISLMGRGILSHAVRKATKALDAMD